MTIKTAYYTDSYIVNPAEIIGVKFNEYDELMFEVKTQDGYIEYRKFTGDYHVMDKSEADRKDYGL